jgi:hypothetical protein
LKKLKDSRTIGKDHSTKQVDFCFESKLKHKI